MTYARFQEIWRRYAKRKVKNPRFVDLGTPRVNAALRKVSDGDHSDFDAIDRRLNQIDGEGIARAKKQPTASGYWWTRPDSACMWRVVEISIIDGTIYLEEMGEDGRDLLPACPWWEWAGPIAPPKS
jgi:hypothetical protein